MKLRLHTCKAEGCQHVISTKLLMCIDHWRMVPVAGRREIVSLSKQRFSARGPEAKLNADAAYSGAIARAVAAVKEKQERKVQAAAGSSGSLFNQ